MTNKRYHRVFVYGTLTNPRVQREVYGRAQINNPTTLPGYERHGLNILPDNNSCVEGFLLDVDDEELHLIDIYENCSVLYKRIHVELGDGTYAYAYQLIGRNDYE